MEEVKSESGHKLVKWYPRSGKDDFKSTGYKGAYLAELYNHHFPVPEGFVITTEAYDYFLNATKLNSRISAVLSSIEGENFDSIERACQEIKAIFRNSEFPEDLKEEIIDSYESLGINKYDIEKGNARDILNTANEPIFVSVRNSVPFLRDNNFGQIREQDTYLNIKGNNEVLFHVKNCFASLFNPNTVLRAIKEENIDKLKTAVLIQKMVEAEKAGIMITKDSAGRILIDAIWGLGEGTNIEGLERDNYILSKELDILERNIGDKKYYVKRDSSGSLKKIEASSERRSACVLNNYEMQRIGDYAEKVEDIFGRTQEMEFAVDESQIYIMQSKEFKLSSDEKEPPKKEEVIELKEPEVAPVEETLEDYIVPEVKKVEKITRTKLKLLLNHSEMLGESLKTGLKKIGVLDIDKITGLNPAVYLGEKSKEYLDRTYIELKKIPSEIEEVWIKLSDYVNPNEKNSLFGFSGARFLVKHKEILKAELEAIKRISPGRNVGILIPRVCTIQELHSIKEILNEVDFTGCKIGVNIDTPASVQLIKEFSDEVDLINLDLDKMIEYLLAIDYSNPDTKELYDVNHPALLYQVEYMLRVCKRKDVVTGAYGSILKNKELLKYLIHKGVVFISILPEEALEMNKIIFALEAEIIKGTEDEPRQYELVKNQEKKVSPLVVAPPVQEETLVEDTLEQKFVEKREDENISPEEDIINEVDELIPEDEADLEEDLQKIEEEKQEYLKQNPEEEFVDDVIGETSEEPEENSFEEINEAEQKKDPLGIF